MSATTYGWLVLAFPLAGSILIGLGFKVLRGKAAGWIGTLAIGLSFAAAEFSEVQAPLTPADERAYDAAAGVWTTIREGLEAALLLRSRLTGPATRRSRPAIPCSVTPRR